MNKALARTLLEIIGDVPYADKRLGIVQKITKVYDNPNNDKSEPVTRSFPISAYANVKECEAKDTSLYDGIPDGKFKGIIYFEDGGVRYIETNSKGMNYSSSIRLVCWLNVKKALGEYRDDYVFLVANSLIEKLTSKHWNNTSFNRIKASAGNIVANSAEIFSKYDYAETKTQYLMVPFDYFAIDFDINFYVNPNCLDSITYLDAPGDCD